MNYYINYLKDTIGQNYLGIKFDSQIIQPYLDKLKFILKDEYETYVNYQQQRDKGTYHMTVINVMDYNKLANEIGVSSFISSLEKVLKYEIDDIKMLGVGTAQKNENKTFFIVCSSVKLDAVRKRYNLPEHDFHITIGFKFKDVLGVRKNQLLDVKSPFKSILINSYESERNWDFLKNVENYNEDKNLEIIPINLKDNYIVVKVGDYYLNIGYLDENEKMWVLAKYKLHIGMPRMSLAKLIQLLKNN
jgi:hypothetical protein